MVNRVLVVQPRGQLPNEIGKRIVGFHRGSTTGASSPANGPRIKPPIIQPMMLPRCTLRAKPHGNAFFHLGSRAEGWRAGAGRNPALPVREAEQRVRAGFIGSPAVNLFAADVVDGGLKFGSAVADVDHVTLGGATRVTVEVRPEDVRVDFGRRPRDRR